MNTIRRAYTFVALLAGLALLTPAFAAPPDKATNAVLKELLEEVVVEMRGKYVLRPRLSWTGLYGKEPWPRERKLWEKV